MKLPFLTKMISDLIQNCILEHKISNHFACHLELSSLLVITFMDTGSSPLESSDLATMIMFHFSECKFRYLYKVVLNVYSLCDVF